MKNQISQLGPELEKKWAEKGNSLELFPELCTQALEGFEWEGDLQDLENWVADQISKGNLPAQLNVYNNFGQPPVTLFNNGEFVVDLYFWVDLDTSLHSHSFSGAFKVLFGKSLHEIYRVKPLKNLATDIMETEIHRDKAEILSKGGVYPIISGLDFSHSLIHLENPTITLCIRTINDLAKSQWHHFPNGWSVEKKTFGENDLKSLFYFQYLFDKDPERGMSFIKDQFYRWQSGFILNLYEQVNMDGMGLAPSTQEALAQFIVQEYGDKDWFKRYENFYGELEENFIPFNQNDLPVERYLEYALNNKYSKRVVEDHLEKIVGKEAVGSFEEILNSFES